ncbi:hypothetical protein [Pantoea septica]|uniref:hypothetical protein n=1 Tax=Pantoea septica TaxID=472695 RepID=UPI0023F93938|nr:hypothetical protein [Pantoea septica]
MATSTTSTDSTSEVTLSRYDDRNISDPVLRALLRQEVMKKCESSDQNLYVRYVRPDEAYRPDLLAYRLWGVHELRWVVTLAAGLEDESEAMTIGQKLYLPPAVWIREMIRHFENDGQVMGTLSVS